VTTERSEAETSVASDPDYRATGRVNLLHLVFANNEDDEDDLPYDKCQINCKRAEPKSQTVHVPAVEVHCVDRIPTLGMTLNWHAIITNLVGFLVAFNL
jgi:hypothetical protein